MRKLLMHEKSGKHISKSIQVDLSFLRKVNIAAEIDSGYKLLLEKHKNQVEKTNFVENINCLIFFGKFELPLRGHAGSTSSTALTQFE